MQMAHKWLNWFINGSQGTEYILTRNKPEKPEINAKYMKLHFDPNRQKQKILR